MPRHSLLTLILSADGSSAKAGRALAALEGSIGRAAALRQPSPAAPPPRPTSDRALAGLEQMFGYFDPLPTAA